MDAAGEKWWFTLSENQTEPRFGLDDSRDGSIRDNLIWDNFGVSRPGQYLDADFSTPTSFLGTKLTRWGASSASVAYLLFQLPARAAFLGTTMMAGAIR